MCFHETGHGHYRRQQEHVELLLQKLATGQVILTWHSFVLLRQGFDGVIHRSHRAFLNHCIKNTVIVKIFEHCV